MPRTPLMLEVQITKEYLGFATHLVYLGTLYEEVLRADTYVRGPGSTVAKVIDGSLHGYRTPASRALPTSAPIATGAARTSIRPTGMRSGGSRNPARLPRTSRAIGCA